MIKNNFKNLTPEQKEIIQKELKDIFLLIGDTINITKNIQNTNFEKDIKPTYCKSDIFKIFRKN